MAIGAVATCKALVDPESKVGFNSLLALSYSSLVMLALAQWITGGYRSPLRELYLITAMNAAGVHPPRRTSMFLVFFGIAIASPIAYAGWNRDGVVDIAARALLLYALAILIMVLIAYIRHQRVVATENQERAHALARVDQLTRLGNRRAFEEALQSEVARHERAGSVAALLLLDVDRFKEINDNHGHRAGDECLRELATAVTEGLRPSDRCYRWGGDEFVVLLPDTDVAGAEQAAARLARAVAASCRRPSGQPLRVSLGVAEVTDAAEADALIEVADLSLFRQKRLALG